MGKSQYLASLTPDQMTQLQQKLWNRQSGRCFICDDRIDLVLHKGQLDIDHIDPLALDGLDAENNFALTHASCNRSKGADNLLIARRLAEFERLQQKAQDNAKRGATLGDVLQKYGGSTALLRLRTTGDSVEYTLPESGDNTIYQSRLFLDDLSGMRTFFTVLPLEYLHHDDRINPRSIGANIRGLIEEFQQKRPQLHISLAWWAPTEDGAGAVKVFDGQHKAAAQILLGVHKLPVRIFVEPDVNVLLQANTHAGSTLRQVAFDPAVLRHLGSSLYADRVAKYQSMRGLDAMDYNFSEKDLVRFFRGEQREMERYIIDAQRDSITHATDNQLLEFIEWAGKGATRPLSYNTIERTFFREFLYKQAMDVRINEGLEEGTNTRLLERTQMIKLMNLFAETFFIRSWDPEIGGQKLENRLQKGDKIPEGHLRAWRVAREEVLANIMRQVRLVIANYFAFTGKIVHEDRLLHTPFPDALWSRITNFLSNLSALPCWIDKNLSTTVFGPKQNLDYWEKVFLSGKSPSGIQILAAPLEIATMIQDHHAQGGKSS